MATRIDPIDETIPAATMDRRLRWRRGEVGSHLSGDHERWRAGVCSPAESSVVEIDELEQRACPALFVLLEGRVVLVFANNTGELHELPLEPGAPVLISQAYAAYCPDGPCTGVALVVEHTELISPWRPVPGVDR